MSQDDGTTTDRTTDAGGRPAALVGRLAELAGYLGAALVLSAACLLLASQWADLRTGERAGWLAGIAAVLVVAAVALLGTSVVGAAGVRCGADPVRCRLVGALLTGAAAATGASAGVLLEGRVSDTATGLAACGLLSVLSLGGYLLAPTVVGQLGIASGLAGVVPIGLHAIDASASPVVGLALLVVGVLWLAAAERGLWQEAGSARVLGGLLALAGAQTPVLGFDAHESWGYLYSALLAAGVLTAYVVRPAWPYLGLGVLAVTLVVPEALTDWTDDAFGPSGLLLVTGLTLLGASLLGFRLVPHRVTRST